MSNNLFTPDLVAIFDPIIDIKPKLNFPVIKGGTQTSWRRYPSTSFSSSSCQFSVPPPNPGTFVSRRFLLEMDLKFVITVVADNGEPSPNVFCLSRFPLASVMKTLSVTINGCSINLPLNEIIHPLAAYNSDINLIGCRENSMSPAQRDRFISFNPATTYGDRPFGGKQSVTSDRGPIPRGCYTPYKSSTDNDSVTLHYKVCEELFLSPLIFGGGKDCGFIGIQSIDINITWDNNLHKLYNWAYSPPDDNENPTNTISSIISSVDSIAPVLLFKYITPPQGFVIPRSVQYQYNQINRYTTELGALVDALAYPAAQQDYNSNNLQLNAIPSRLFIMIQPTEAYLNTLNGTMAAFNPQLYAGITQVSIQWNNRPTLLSNMGAFQLYDMCRENGVSKSFLEFSNSWISGTMGILSEADNTTKNAGSGSVICVQFGTDIGLEKGEAPGQVGTYNLQVSVKAGFNGWLNPTGYNTVYENQGSINQKIQMKLIVVTPGVFTIYDNAASQRIGVINKSDVLNAKRMANFSYMDFKKEQMMGGINWGKALRFGRRFSKLAKPFTKGTTFAPIHKTIRKSLRSGQKMKRAKKRRLGEWAESRAKGSGMSVGGKKRRKKPGPKKKKR